MTVTTPPDVKHRLTFDLLDPAYRDRAGRARLRGRFAAHDYVRLPNLLGADAFALLRAEIGRLESFARQRDIVMAGPNTPRTMKVLGGTDLLRLSDLLWVLYSHVDLQGLINLVVDDEIGPCLHRDEFMVCNFLLQPGATHGWHLDDPAFALVILFEAPPEEGGGALEFIPGWKEICRALEIDPHGDVSRAVEWAARRGRIRTVHHQAGDAYLLRADRCLHRVTELKEETVRRVVLNLAYDASDRPQYGDTASLLYGDQ